jgi:hypothetical protein
MSEAQDNGMEIAERDAAQEQNAEKTTLSGIGKMLRGIVKSNPHGAEYWRDAARRIQERMFQDIV